MAPKKDKKKTGGGDAENKKNSESRDLEKESELKAELEKLTKDLENAKIRVYQLKEENEWLEQEAIKITEESQEYMNFMSKKANLRQNSIITLSDQNKQEIENLKAQKDECVKEFERKRQTLHANLVIKQDLLNKIKKEIEEMSEYKDIKRGQLNEIKGLEKEILEVRKEQTRIISEIRGEFIREKTNHKREADEKIAVIVKAANKEAKECLGENTYKIKQENQELRAELLDLIRVSKELNAQKEKMQAQKVDLLKEINYADDLKKVRNTQQQKILTKLIHHNDFDDDDNN